MRIARLSEEDENLWLKNIENDRVEFIYRLHRELGASKKDVKIKLSNKVLERLFLKAEKIEDLSSEYDCYKYYFIEDIDRDILLSLFNYLDLTDFVYDNLVLNQTIVDIMENHSMVLYLDKIYSKDLSNLKINNCIIEGTFDGVRLRNTSIINCRTKSNEKIMINPQKVLDKSFLSCKISNVLFMDSFDDCYIRGLHLIENENVKINPLKLKYHCLEQVCIDGGEFTGSLNGCDIYNLRLCNVKGAYLNMDFKDDVIYKNNRFSCINLIVENDIAFSNIEEIISSDRSCEHMKGATVTCKLKYQRQITSLLNKNINKSSWNDFSYAKVNVLESTMDKDILDVLCRYNLRDEIISKGEDNNQKKKKRSIFDRIRKV